MANIRIVRGSSLPNSANKSDVHSLIESSVITLDSLVNADFHATAGIVDSKLQQITTGGKVNLSALSITGQTAGDTLWSSDGVAFTRLPIGTAGQKLKMDWDSYTKLMLHGDGTDGLTTITDEKANTVTNVEGYDTYTKFLFHADGADAAQPTTDTVGKTSTSAGNAQLDRAQYKFGTASILFDGSGDYITIPWSTDFDFDGTAFTVDFWMKADSTGGATMGIFGDASGAENGWDYFINLHNGNVAVYYSGGTLIETSGTDYRDDSWHHVEVNRSGITNRIYVDGVLKVSNGTSVGNWDNGAVRVIGNASDDGGYRYGFKGWIDEFRVSKGVARHTANFDVPTSAYGTYVEVDTDQSKFGGASLYFRSAYGTKLTLADSDDWSFGAGDFTIDFWVRFGSVSAGQYFIWQQASASEYWWIYKDTSINGHKLNMKFVTSSSTKGNYYMASNWSVEADRWYHLAFVRNSTAGYIFIDGVSQTLTTATSFSSNNVGNVSAVLNISSITYGIAGWIDEFRISKGIARWTAGFTPPTTAYAVSLGWVTP